MPAPRVKVVVFIGQGDDMIPFGRTRDLSVSGMFLETELRPPLDSDQNICLVWGDESLSCVARVVRHAADGIGLSFKDPDAAFVQAVNEIIGTSGEGPAPRY
jgi:hypothetical protein